MGIVPRPTKNDLNEALRIAGFAVWAIAVSLASTPWDTWLIAAGGFAILAYLTLVIVRRINRRDDPRFAKRPLDPS